MELTNSIQHHQFMSSRYFLLALILFPPVQLYAADEDLESHLEITLKAKRMLTQATWRSAGAVDEQCNKSLTVPLSWGNYIGKDEKAAEIYQRVAGFSGKTPVVVEAIETTGLHPRDRLVPIAGDSLSEKAYAQFVQVGGALPFWNTAWFTRVYSTFKMKVEGTDTIVNITPYETCEGRVVMMWPRNGADKTYTNGFGTSSVTHPYQVFSIDITPDEVLWLTLWTQGYIADGNGKQQAVKWGKILLHLIPGPSITTHAEAIRSAVGNLGSTVSDATRKGQDSMEVSAAKAGFKDADAWAFSKMVKLNADITAPLTLSKKLEDAEIGDDAMVLDEVRKQTISEMIQAVLDKAGQVTAEHGL